MSDVTSCFVNLLTGQIIITVLIPKWKQNQKQTHLLFLQSVPWRIVAEVVQEGPSCPGGTC